MVSSLENNHIIFRLTYLADIFQQLNEVTLKLQERGRTIVDFIDILSTFVEKLDNGKRKVQAGNFAMFEIVPQRLVIKCMLIWHRKLFNTTREYIVLYFPEIIKANWIWRKIFLLFQLRMVQIAWKINSSTFETILGPNTCWKLKQFVIFA